MWTETPLKELAAVAQGNADLADAHHAQTMSLCAYLLDMREFYRWERGLALDAVLPRPELSAWISRREERWDSLREAAGAGFASLSPAGMDDPFDEAAANAALESAGLVYGAGVGRFGRPLFFLAERLRQEAREGLRVLVAGRELARGMNAPPALSRDGLILVRLDALERWLWTRYEEWRHHPRDNGFRAAWAGYGGDGPEHDPDPVASVRRMAAAEVETLILHEIGEQRAGRVLGEAWEDMLDGLASRKAEVFLRAVRDLLADCEHTLPTLLDRGARESIHFWFGNLEGMRKTLAPDLLAAYGEWKRGSDAALADAVAAGAAHWRATCQRLLAGWAEHGAELIDGAWQAPERYARGAALPL